jgi:hypothetical protein
LKVLLAVGDPIKPKENESAGFTSLSELLSHLDRQGGTAAVVVALKPPPCQSVPSAAETERLATELIARAERATGLRVARSNVFRRFGRFVFDGPAELIRYVAAQPEVAETTPNEFRDLGLSKPVRQGPAEGW